MCRCCIYVFDLYSMVNQAAEDLPSRHSKWSAFSSIEALGRLGSWIRFPCPLPARPVVKTTNGCSLYAEESDGMLVLSMNLPLFPASYAWPPHRDFGGHHWYSPLHWVEASFRGSFDFSSVWSWFLHWRCPAAVVVANYNNVFGGGLL